MNARPGPWAIYPKVLATSTGEIERHAMIWFDDLETARRYADAESAHVGIEHEAYLATAPKVHFVEHAPGIMVKGDNPAAGRKAMGRLTFLRSVLEAAETL